jgi:hypothetical protein
MKKLYERVEMKMASDLSVATLKIVNQWSIASKNPF